MSSVEIDSLSRQCPKISNELQNETILIFGGSGSLGKKTIEKWIGRNKIVNVSRNEEKQWLLKSYIKSPDLSQIIGDVSSYDDVMTAILSARPTIVCVMACLKHIDICEKFPEKALKNNTSGLINIQKVLTQFNTQVHTVLYVSTDKACCPITTYGYSKAMGESVVQQTEMTKTKWVCVRYGNVLNSSGSIIQYLENSKNSPEAYILTHPEMTRFLMTLDQSVNLIEYALLKGKNKEIIIPLLYSMKIEDLIKLFCEKYGKNISTCGLRCKEKIHEDLLSEYESNYAYKLGSYIHITPCRTEEKLTPFDSSSLVIDKKLLKKFLTKEGLF